MTSLRYLLLLFTLLPLSVAEAQTVQPPYVPIVCAYNASPPTLTTGTFGWVQCDSTGHIATGGGGGGGGTVASPDIIGYSLSGVGTVVPGGAYGPYVDVASNSALLNALNAPIPTQSSHGQNIGAVEGVTAVGATPTEYPLYAGGLAAGAATPPAPTTDGKKSAVQTTLSGKVVTEPYAAPGYSFTATASTGTNTTLISANASYRIAITDIECDTQTAATAAGVVVLTDGASNTMARFGMPNLGQGAAHEAHFLRPPHTSAINSAVTMTVTGGQTTACTANYFLQIDQ